MQVFVTDPGHLEKRQTLFELHLKKEKKNHERTHRKQLVNKPRTNAYPYLS